MDGMQTGQASKTLWTVLIRTSTQLRHR